MIFSRFTTIYFLKNKFKVFKKFQIFQALVENQFHLKIQILRSDNGGEYISQQFKDYCVQHGIVQHFTIPYSPSQNGIAERKMRTLVECARSMLKTSNLPKKFWAEATATACYVQNRSFTSSLNNSTPFEKWTGSKPTLSHLRIFGCPAYEHIPMNKRTKWDYKANKCIFIGYGEMNGIKGYRLYNEYSRQITISRSVIFNEDALLPSSISNNRTPIPTQLSYDFYENPIQPNPIQSLPSTPPHIVPSTPSNNELTPLSLSDSESVRTSSPNSTPPSPSSQHRTIASPNSPMLHRLACNHSPSSPRRSTRSNKGTWKSTKFHDSNLFAYAFMAQITEPQTVQEALDRVYKLNWQQAMQSEYDSLLKNKTWILVDPPPNASIISTKWLFHRKYNSDGSLSRYKARFVARGFTQ